MYCFRRWVSVLDPRISEYMSDVTDHLQTGTATDTIMEGGANVGLRLRQSGVRPLHDGQTAKIWLPLYSRLRSLLFQTVSDFSREDMDGFSAVSLITHSTNDVYQIQQFLSRVIVIVVKAPFLEV